MKINMHTNPLVSIVMAAYNAENFIVSTVNSIFSQTYTNWELIIVDDLSKDRTREIIQKIDDNRIRLIISEKNGGPGVARNKGIEAAKGQFLAFLDTDDIWSPDKIQKQVEFMLKNNYPISHTSYSFINEAGEAIPGYVKVSPVVNQNSYMKNTEIGLSTSMINRQLVKKVQFSPMRDREDTRLWIELLASGYNSYGIEETLMKYRVREGQVSGNKFKSAFRTLKLYLDIKNIPIHSRILNFGFYFINGIIKRFKK